MFHYRSTVLDPTIYTTKRQSPTRQSKVGRMYSNIKTHSQQLQDTSDVCAKSLDRKCSVFSEDEKLQLFDNVWLFNSNIMFVRVYDIALTCHLHSAVFVHPPLAPTSYLWTNQLTPSRHTLVAKGGACRVVWSLMSDLLLRRVVIDKN